MFLARNLPAVPVRRVIGRVGAVDYGSKHIGLAIGDTTTRIAFPAGTIPGARSRKAPLPETHIPRVGAEAVMAWARTEGINGVIVGHPLNMDGSAGPQARHSEALVVELRRGADAAQLELAVDLWDERLSSFQADEHLARAGLKRAKRPGLRDALAAQIILQSWFNSLDGDQPPAP
jgi:putative Holliday junction resolvase